MKKTIILGIIAAGSLILSSCEKVDHAQNQKVEYYASFELVGGDPYILPIGTSWSDPGVKAISNGEDVSSSLKVYDEVDDETIGSYSVEYVYTNPDGFSSSITRTVYVCNPEVTTDLAGTYTSVEGTVLYSINEDGETVEKPFAGYQVKINKVCPGFFQIDDMLAKFYEDFYGNGAKYNHAYDFCAEGNLSLNPDNTLELVSGGYVGAWGDYAGDFREGKYDPETETISFVVTYNGMDFNVVIKKD